MAIHTSISGKELDSVLRPLYEGVGTDGGSDGTSATLGWGEKVVYISDGKLSFADGDMLFNI